MIGRFIRWVQRLFNLQQTGDLVSELMMGFEEPILIDGPSEAAFLVNRWKIIALGVLSIVVAFGLNVPWLTVAAFLFASGVALMLVISALRDHYTRYVITTDRVVRIEGVLSRQQNSIPYSKVTDLTFMQSASDRLILKIARVRIESANEASPFRDLEDLTQPRLFMHTLTTMLNIRQAPNRLGLPQTGTRFPKKVEVLLDLLDQIEEAGLKAYTSRNAVVQAVFEDWVDLDELKDAQFEAEFDVDLRPPEAREAREESTTPARRSWLEMDDDEYEVSD